MSRTMRRFSRIGKPNCFTISVKTMTRNGWWMRSSPQWKRNKLEFLVRWNLGDTTWEPYEGCKELEALDKYLELQGLNEDEWKKLSRRTTLSLKRTTPAVSSR